MKVLVLGNSQAGALKRAYETRATRDSGIDLHFYVIPGGVGPDLDIVDDRLVLGAVSPKYPPYVLPVGTDTMPLSSFDAILVSALGYVDGGYAYKNAITVSGVLAEFGPRGPATVRAPVSDSCFAEMLAEGLEQQPGVRALRRLCSACGRPIFVQPFPHLSDQVAEHPDWGLAQWYDDPLGAHRVMAEAKEAALAALAEGTGARLLPYPVPHDANRMTPRAMMRETDGVHQSDAYGALVLDQLESLLTGGDAGPKETAVAGAT